MKSPRFILTGLFASALLLPWLPSASATDAIWTGGAGNWSNTALWSPATVPNGTLFSVLIDNGNVLNSIVSLDMNAILGGLTIDAGDTLGINNAVSLTLSNALVNNAGIISLNSIGSGANVYIDGTVTFQGAGKVVLGTGGSNAIRYSGAAGTDNLINKQTVEGRGSIDVLLDNQSGGLIDANVNAEMLDVFRAVTNAGTLRASNGGNLSLNSIAVTNMGGVITATSGGTVYLRNSTITGGTLTNAGGTIYSGNLTTLDGTGGGITLNGTYTLANTGQSILKGTINNNNLIAMNSLGSGTALFIDGTVNLQGAGKVTMNNAGSNTIVFRSSAGTDSLNSFQTIEGRGDINVLFNNTAGQLVDANVSGEYLSILRATTNSGTLRASNGGILSLNSIAVANTGSVITATSGGTVYLNNSTITGGTLTNSGGTLYSGNLTTLDGTGVGGITLNGTYTLANTGQSILKGTINNNNLIAMNSGGSGTSLFIDGTVNLQGPGKVTMNSAGSNVIRYNGAPGTDTLNNYQIIEGNGTLDVILTNQATGLIDANVSGGILAVARNLTNTGTMQSSGGGHLSIATTTINNVGGTIQALTGSSLGMVGGAIVNGGTVKNLGGTVTLAGVTLNGTDAAGITLVGAFGTPNASSVTLVNSVYNTGTISMNSVGSGTSFSIGGDGTGVVNLRGSGTVTLGALNGGADTILASTAGNRLINENNTIQGRGVIGNGTAKLTNMGVIDANNATGTLIVNPQTGSNVNSGTMRASSGGTLNIQSSIANFSGVTNGLVESMAGSIVQVQGAALTGGVVRTTGTGEIQLFTGTITGGTLQNSATGKIRGMGGTSTINGLDNAAGGQVFIENASTLVVQGTLQNAGTIRLNSIGSGAELHIDGTVTFQGAGKVVLGTGGSNAIRYSGAAGTDNLISKQTIEGQGDINVLLNNQSAGVVDANSTGQTLNVLQATTNGGTLRASNGGVLSLGSIAVANTGGVITATSGGTVYLNNSTITGGTLTNAGGTIYSGNLTTLDGSGGGVITLNGTYTLANVGQSILKGTIQNNSLIAMNSGGSGTSLFIDGTVNLQGAGKVTMNNAGSNTIVFRSSAGTDTLNSFQTIEGRGDINVLLNNTAGQLVDANVSGEYLSVLRDTTNSGTLRASNGGILSLNSIAVANTGSVITATSGGTVYLNNSTITGGTLTNAGGTIYSGNLTTLDGTGGGGITLNGIYILANVGQSILKGTIQNNNLIAMNSGGSGTSLFIDGTVSLQGPGKVTMNNNGSNLIRYNGAPGTDSLNNYQTIEGNGTLNVNLTNHATGLIDANVSGGTLAVSRNVTNEGLMQSSGGGILSIATTTINNVGGTIQALTGSSVGIVSGARVNGGTVKNLGGTVTLAGVTLDGTDALGITLVGTFGVPNATSVTLVNTVYNTGTLSMNSGGSGTALFIGGDGPGTVNLRGNGTVTLGALNDGADTILASTAGNRLINENNTIQGRGVIGNGTAKLTNGGLILANVSGQTLTVTPQNVAGAGMNTGIMRASGGGLLTINNTIENNGGLVEAATGSIITVQNGTVQSAGVGTPGTLQTIGTGEVRLSNGQILNGSLLNSSAGVIRSVGGTSRINTLNNAAGGQVIVNNATTLALQGTLTNNGSIAVNSAGSGANLAIEGAVTLLGTGEVTLGTGGSNRLGWGTSAASDLLTNPQQHIQGMGMIDVKLTNQSLGVVDGNVTNQTLAMNRDVTNTGKLQASNSGILSLESIAVANTSGLITATSGGTVYLRNSTITGGTLTNAGGTIYSGNLTTLDGTGVGGITLNGTYTLDNVGQSILKGTINNNNLIAMNSGGSGTTLFIDGTVNLQDTNLQGDGVVTMNNAGSNSIRYNTNPATDVLYNHQTIQGRGDINVLLYNSAGKLVDANVTGETLSISRPTTNEGALNLNPADGGLLRATNGGTLSLNSIYVGNSRATIQALGTGATVLMNSSTIYGGVIENAGGTILSGSGTFLDGTAPDAITLNGTYTIANTGITALKGTINNNNLIAMNSGGSGTGLYIDGTVTLQGAGKVTMNNNGSNLIRYNGAAGSDVLFNKQTIEGKGTIDVLFQNDNGRLVDANVTGDYLLMTRQVANNGYLRASNGGILQLNNIYVANTSAVIEALAGSSVLMTSSTIYGGYIVNAGGGIYSGSNTWFDGTGVDAITVLGAYTIGNAQTTVLKGTVNNEGQINLVSGGSGANLRIDGIVDLQGAGTVTMNNDSDNHIYYNGSAGTDGLNNFQTIQGRGSIDVIVENKSSGIVNANIAGQTLTIDRDVTNRGVLRAENGGMLSINAIGLSTGQIDSRSGSQVSFNSSSFLLDQGTTITGVAQTRLIAGTTYIGDSQGDTIPTSNFLVTGGTLTGPGTMNVSGSFTLTAGTVAGSGDLDFLAGSTNSVNGSSSTIDARPVTNHGTLTLAVDSLTMRGGAVLSNHGTLYVQGTTTVNGNADGGSSIENYDLLRKTGSGNATLNTSFVNTETVEVQSGTLTLNGTSISSGAYMVNNDANQTNLDFGTGTHNLNAGASISGTGQARVNGGGTLNVNANVHAADLAFISGTIQGSGNLIIDDHMYWSAATMYGSGQTIIASGATMEIATGATKFLSGRNLRNNGTVNWSSGTIVASDGADFINAAGGKVGVSGNVTFSRVDETSEFINNGELALPAGTTLTVNSDFTNNGKVGGPTGLAAMGGFDTASAPPANLTINGNVKGNGLWENIGAIWNWITGGIFGPKTVTGSTTVSGGGRIHVSGPAPVTIKGSLNIASGAELIGDDGASLIGDDGASMNVTGLGSSMVAPAIAVNGPGTKLTVDQGATATSTGPGGIEGNGPNQIEVKNTATLKADAGGSVLSHNGNAIVAGGGGNIVAAGGGNIVAGGGGNIVAAGGGNVISHNGNARPAGAAKSGAGESQSALFSGAVILAENGGNLIGHTGGIFDGNVTAQSGGSLLPGNAGAAGTMTIINGGLDLQAGSLLKMDLLGLTQGTGYDFLNVGGIVAFNGNLLVNMAYGLRTIASNTAFIILTAASPITGIIGNLLGNRILEQTGFGSFRATYGVTNNVVLDDFQATPLDYPLWQTAWNFASTSDKDFSATPANDGIPNGVKYALGLDPLAQGHGFLPAVSVMDLSGVKYLALTYVRATGVNVPTDIITQVERSTDMSAPGGGWSTTGIVQHTVTPGPQSGYETVVVRSTTPIGTPGVLQEFLHLKVTKP